MKAWVLLAAVALAGCLDTIGQAEPTIPAPLEIFATACPPAGSWSPRDGVCVGTLGGEDWSTSEPVVAIDPRDPKRFAIGVISKAPVQSRGSGPTLPELPLSEPQAPACESFGICVFWTEDAGTTWTHSNPPAGPERIRGADPTMAFDSEGRLHFASLINQGKVGGIAYTSTLDGREWTDPVEIVMDAGQDRPWLGVHGTNVVIVWQDRDWNLHGVESWDSGRTFRPELDPWPKCNVMSMPANIDDYFTVTCADRAGSESVRLMQMNHGRWEPISELPPSPGPTFLAHSATFGPVAAYPGIDGKPKLVLRDDAQGGAWTTIDVLSRTDAMQDWKWSWVGALAVDATDIAHLLILGGEGERCFNAVCEDGSYRHAVHVAIDLADGRRVGRSLLTPDPEAGPDRVRGPQQYPDDYDSVAFTGDRGVAAWGREGVVDWTILEPARV